MKSKCQPEGRQKVAAVLAALLLLGLVLAHWFPPNWRTWQLARAVEPGCVCPSVAAAPQALPLQKAGAASCCDAAHEGVAVWKRRVRRLPWRAYLSPAEARRGTSYSGSGAGLRRLAAKLLAGQPVSIAAIGGSVTSLGGTEPDGESYIARIFQYINTTFPHRQHQVHNKGIPAWGSQSFEPCLETTVPQGVDLVVVEFAVNDKPGHMASKHRRFHELVLRRLLRLPSQPAVLQLQLYQWWRSSGDGVQEGLYYSEPETQMTLLGQYYDLPVLSLRAAAWRLMHAGVEGFQVDKVTLLPDQRSLGNRSHIIPLADAAEKECFFYMDPAHPDPSKLRVLAELVIHQLATAVEQVAAGVPVQERQDARLQGLPPPMLPGVQDTTASLCYVLEDFKPLVKQSHGFQYRPERPRAPSFVLQKWGWTGLQPGDWAELDVDTQQLEAASRKEGHTILRLTYLTSFEGMGTANVSCISGCTCPANQVKALQPHVPTSTFTFFEMAVSFHPHCRVRVEIIGQRVQATQQKFMMSALSLQGLL